MNKTRASNRNFGSALLTFIAAFLSIKILGSEIYDQVLRHIAVAAVLLIFPVLHRRSSLFFFRNLTERARHSWGGYFCLIYALIPVLILLVQYPQEWTRARLELARWTLSTAGLSAVLVAPLAEEFFFRGWLLSIQVEWQKSRETLSAQSVINCAWLCYWNALFFWIFHIPIQSGMLEVWKDALSRGLVPLSPGPFLLGLTACALTRISGTPRAALLFHSLANALGPLWWPLLRDQNLRSFFYF